MIINSPYLSIVATSRNDDHGGNLLKRMQIFVDALLAQCDRHQLEAELVLVEWNPPLDRPRLKEALKFPSHHSYCQVRIIEVSKELHQQFKYSESLPLFQMIAKNVGIRRSIGQFILATNIDVVFSNELIAFLAKKQLKENYFYRADRYDVDSKIPVDISLDEQLNFCENHLLRICERNGTRDFVTGEYHRVYSVLPYIPMKLQHLAYRIHRKLNWKPAWFNNFWIGTACVPVHTNACGDFTLMSREAWFQLFGYPELEMFSFHIDSLFCHMAYHLPLKEHVLSKSMRVYHIDHNSGWTPAIEKDRSMDNRLMTKGIPRLQNEDFENYAIQMKKNRKPIQCNEDSWGLANETLPEMIFCV